MMLFIVVTGIIAVTSVKEEIFPEFELGRINIEVPYLGAAPEEVEAAVNIRIEEAIQGIDGIKQIQSTASEGRGTVMIELELGADARKVVDDVKSNVDAITTFPVETEKPIIRELTRRNQVADIAVSGDLDPFRLKAVTEQVRSELAATPEITQVDVVSAPPYEISIEVSEVALRRHGMTFDQVAAAVRNSSLDLPGGSVRTESGEILLRTIGQAYQGEEFERLVLWTRVDGSRLQLGDVATVVDGFAETDQYARFDVQPTMMVSVFRTGEQSALEIAARVHEYVEDAQTRMPGVTLTVWQDQSKILTARLGLMLRSGASGFVLVFIVLALFLELRLAFWVSLGIPISFLGAIALMPVLDVSINIMSLFGFILVLGIVVDDAIIVGENIFSHQEQDGDRLGGAISGAQEIAKPVIFAVLTTVAAFLPLMFVPGMFGKFFRVIPLIVIPCLLFSLIESLQILPAHLSHRGRTKTHPGAWRRFQSIFANGLKRFIQRVYRPFLDLALRWRYLTVSVAASTVILTLGMVASGRPAFHFMPKMEAEFVNASVDMPPGTPASVTAEAVERLEAGAARLRARLLEETGEDYVRHVSVLVGDQPRRGTFQSSGGGASADLGGVTIELAPTETRVYNSDQLGNMWREATGPIPEAVGVDFEMATMTPGSDVDVQLAGSDLDVLRAAAIEVKQRLLEYSGVYEVTDSFRAGKEEVKLGIEPSAEALGLTLQDLGRQVRQAFYGEEAQRIQRGRDDVRVMVRYPRDERRSLGDLENMRIRTPDGGAVPFGHVAQVEARS